MKPQVEINMKKIVTLFLSAFISLLVIISTLLYVTNNSNMKDSDGNIVIVVEEVTKE